MAPFLLLSSLFCFLIFCVSLLQFANLLTLLFFYSTQHQQTPVDSRNKEGKTQTWPILSLIAGLKWTIKIVTSFLLELSKAFLWRRCCSIHNPSSRVSIIIRRCHLGNWSFLSTLMVSFPLYCSFIYSERVPNTTKLLWSLEILRPYWEGTYWLLSILPPHMTILLLGGNTLENC